MADIPADSQQPQLLCPWAILEMEPQTPPSHSLTAAPSMRAVSTIPAQMQIQEPQSVCSSVIFFHSKRQQQMGQHKHRDQHYCPASLLPLKSYISIHKN